ncbi:MAG TPA: serine hydrolase domain-containing protein [Candidatus Limiplasma sp.]|nr:serine hydrolase domain-containing protein [Candidatus Limiplasma sp.]
MRDVGSLWQALSRANPALYDFALITSEGMFFQKLRPCGHCHNGYSVAKVLVMTAIGLLYDDGALSPNDYVSNYVEIPPDADARWHEVTLQHLLCHHSGLGKPFLDIDCDDIRAYPTDDYLSLVLLRPLPFAPGTHYQYSDAVFYLLSRVVSAIAACPADALLQARLFRPMRFGETAWSRCPKGYPIGGTGLYAGADDMAKLAWLYLCGGIYEGKRLLSESWVNMALNNGYELAPFGNTGWTGKGGMYGQGIAFHRDMGVAAAWHAYDLQRQEGAVFEVLNRVLPNLLDSRQHKQAHWDNVENA